ncbi:MAG: hypothetical protein GF311_14660 [Candidatus Lokiarchaeota archaeon]|nr:hypothetical protein [Candidatus Lokiarchaeota archaeon]
MAIYTPMFNEIRKFLYKEIGKYLAANRKARINEINRYIRDLKKVEPEKYRLIKFTYSMPYSEQIQKVLVDMVRHNLIEKTTKGYQLTKLGKNYASTDEKWI